MTRSQTSSIAGECPKRRWDGFIEATASAGGPADPARIVAVKAVQTLVNNWRGPAGRFAHGGLFPSSNVWYFNGFWAWDSWKHAVALARFAPEVAADQLRLMAAQQDDAGMIADVVYLDPEEDNWRDTKPPLLGWAIEEVFEATGEIIPVQGPEGWIPLWAGVATDEQAARVRETMLDPEVFRTHLPFPTVAANDPEFSEGYWRGLVWLDQVFFAIEGLEMYGFTEDADALTAQVLGNLEGAAVPGEPLYENYHPLTGEGRNVRHFSWTAAHLLLLSLESQ